MGQKVAQQIKYWCYLDPNERRTEHEMTSKKKSPPLVAEKRDAPAPKKNKIEVSKPNFQKRTGFHALLKQLLLLPFRLLWALTWRLSLAITCLVSLGVVSYVWDLPPALDLVDGTARGSVTFFDRNGAVYAWRGDEFRGVITAETASQHLKNAVVATEDKRFFRHLGLSPRGVASAIRINLRSGRGPLSGNGGSTITQQTAKLLCLGRAFETTVWKSERDYERNCRRTTLWRKIKEATFALALEYKFTKDEILTIYLNRAFLGAGSRGFEAASQRYFGKSASEVNVAESAMLAGLLKAPSRLAPTDNLSGAQARAAVVIDLMQDQNYLATEQTIYAKKNPATLSKAATARAGGYFADWIMASAPDYLTRKTTEDVKIWTTLDPEIQRSAEAAVQKVFDTKIDKGSEAQTAVLVMSADGAVRAMIGGRNSRATGAFNRATQAKRQTGSAFKPFIYATVLELGAGPLDIIRDEPVTYNIPGSGPWTPSNYNKEFAGDVTYTLALSNSLNIPAIKVSEFVGRENVRTVASDFGIQSDLALGPALALGASESSLLEMTGAYAGILNGGSSVDPYGVEELRLAGATEALSGRNGGIGERVISERAARDLIYMMHQVVQTGTAQKAQITGIEIAGKTGTTQAARDAWFIGFTSDFVIGVWMGYDDNRPLKGVTGGSLPTEIWYETMLAITAERPPGPLPMTRNPTKMSDQRILDGGSNRSDTKSTIFNTLYEILMGKN